MNKINVLVTGCGGDIGQSIGKILNQVNFINELYAIDINQNNAGKFIYKNFSLGLPCNDPNYISFLYELINKYKIDILIPISEPELRFFSQQDNLNIFGEKIITANLESLKIGFDKFKTSEFLKENNLLYPETFKIRDCNLKEIKKYPVVLKHSKGSGSKNIFIAQNEETLVLYSSMLDENYIIQEYISGDMGEFTCGLYRSKNNEIKTIIFKRKLIGGFSGYGNVVYNKDIDILLHTIAEAINLQGSINVQLRLTNKGPVVFEINPRFSSTVYFRHLFGFYDLLWSIQDKMNWSLFEFEKEHSYGSFYKGFSEYIEINK